MLSRYKCRGFEKPEIIINQFENIKTKLAYYQKAYNDDLTLKTFNGIRIIGFAAGNSLPEIQIRAQYPDEHSKMTAPYLYVESRFGRVPWKETMIELFSDKWEIVE